MDIEYRKSGQIPAFGDWDKANELPITQYFECARQAGLVRYSCSSGEYDGGYAMSSNNWGGYGGANSHLYAVGYRKPPPLRSLTAPPPKTSGVINKRPEVKERRTRQVKVREVVVMDKPKSHKQQQQQKQHFPRHTNNKSSTRRVAHQLPTVTTVKPLDEDLYEIPPHVLHKSERKKMLGFFSRCLVPPCKA